MTISDNAFQYCSELSSVTFTGTSIPPLSNNTFPPKSQNITAYYTVELSQNYVDILIATFQYVIDNNGKSRPLGNSGTTFTYENGSQQITEIVGALTGSSYDYTTKLASVEIGNSVTSIEDNVFKTETKMTSVTFANNSTLTTIGLMAFFDTWNLNSIEIPASVTSFETGAFGNYSPSTSRGLSSITFANSISSASSLTNIADSVFYNCADLTSISIPDSLTYIGGSAFYVSGLNTVYINSDTLSTVNGNVLSNDPTPSFGTNQSFYGKSGVTVIES
tara:strand:+ start:154 stop:984 length:831 start_codon:yes stop_codon:yes gene_type:complete